MAEATICRPLALVSGCLQDSDENVRQLPATPYWERMRPSYETATKTPSTRGR